MRTPSRLPQNIECSARETCAESGAKVTQLTSAAFISTNVYPESPVFTPDSRRFIFARFQSTMGPREYWLCDLPTRRIRPLTDEGAVHAPVVTPDGAAMLYIYEREEYELELRRVDLDDFTRETVCVVCGHRWPYSLGTISPDGRWYVTGVQLREGDWGILRIDVEGKTSSIINRAPDIFNPHAQIDRHDGTTVLVQHNRGGEVDAAGRKATSTGEMGATLYLVDLAGGKVAHLNIGLPYTDRIQGHQSWIGTTKEIICTLSSPHEKAVEQGNLVTIKAGDDAAGVVAKGYYYCHANVSRDGKWFVSDVRPGGHLILGSMATGKTRLLCDSGSSFGAPQYTHPHPFFTPDGKQVLFNSDRTGLGQIFAATVPDALLAGLE